MVALEQIDAERLRLTELRGRFDLLGDQLDLEAPQHLDDHRDQQRVDSLEVDFHDVDRRQQLVELVEVAYEVVERDPVAALAQLAATLDRRFVDDALLEELEHDAVGRQRVDQVAVEEVDVDVQIPVDGADHLG